MARRFSGHRKVGSLKRLTMWGEEPAQIVNLGSANTASLISTLSAGGLLARPFTVIRTHLFFGIRTDQVAADESFDCAIGQAVVSDQAAAIGVTAVPTPFTDLGSDLFYLHEILMNRFEFAGASASNIAQMLTWTKVDSKAMRKVNDDEDLITVIENSSISSGVTVHVAGRFLVKLH